MEKNIRILISLIFILVVINYSFLDSLLVGFFSEGEVVFVEKVIDGDTIVVNRSSVRLLGINSPESKRKYYEEAKEFLEEAVVNKTVVLKFGKDKYDKYDRVLAYVFVGAKNINLELVREGFANFYFPSGKDVYYNEFLEAWEECEKNLCEKSEYDCVVLEKFDYKEEVVIFYNNCSFDLELTGWEIKDEGRKSFVFPSFVLGSGEKIKVIVSKENKINSESEIYWIRNDYVWTDSGDTLFLRDDAGKLVLWESY